MLVMVRRANFPVIPGNIDYIDKKSHEIKQDEDKVVYKSLDEIAEDLQNVAGTVRGIRDVHADALADGVIEADQTPTTVRVDPLAAAALVTGLLVPLGLWLQALLD